MFRTFTRRQTLAVIVCAVLLVGIILGRYIEPVSQAVATAVSGRLVPIYKVDTPHKRIAISFDATWGTELTDEILAILERNNVKTTFFLAGNWIEKHPDYVQKIDAAGHEIGTHSYAHPHMNAMTKEAIIADLEKNHALLEPLVSRPIDLFRPPFGEYSNKVIEAATSLGYHTVQWSIDSLDWKDVSADFMVRRVLQNLSPGEIVLFHNAGTHTPKAVETLLPELAARGYEVVPVGELIYKEDYTIDPHSGLQRQTRRAGEPVVAPVSTIPEGAVFEVEGATGMASFAVNVDWGEAHIPTMLDQFAAHDVRVTFFVTGRWAERNQELLRRMVDAGHEIANHGLSHAHPKRLNASQLTEHIAKNQELLNRLTGGRAAPLYAPPYGEWDARIVATALQLGYRTVLWTLDTIDWQDPTPATIVNRISPRLAAGNIVLMHPRANTVEALPQLIAGAHGKGLQLVPVGQMLKAAAGL